MKIVRSVAVVSAAAAMALVPVAAQADTKSHHDASGDVSSVAYDPVTQTSTDTPTTPEPAATRGDLTKIKVSLSSGSLKFVLRFRDLAKTGSEQFHELGIASPNGRRYVFVDAGPGRWQGRTVMTKANLKTRVKCSIGGHISYGKNTITVKVPTSCLGHPKVVKVGVKSVILDGTKAYYDQGYAVAGPFSGLLAASPKIHR
ncbi:MAG TPA: hypothetical protein VF416_07855 [Marmoricola sp.]